MSKTAYYIAASVGGAVGGWLPTLFGAGWLSAWSIIGSTLGGLIGIAAAYKIGQYF